MFQGYIVRPSSQETNKSKPMLFPGQTGKGFLSKPPSLVQPACNCSSSRGTPFTEHIQCCIVLQLCSETVRAGSEDTGDDGTRLHSCRTQPLCLPFLPCPPTTRGPGRALRHGREHILPWERSALGISTHPPPSLQSLLLSP